MKAHSPSHQHGNPQSIFEFLPGPVKIKDGLFMGDEIAARDIEFIISNKVTHIINTVSRQIPNLWERFGIHYLSVNWTEKQENIFDKKNNAVNTVFQFIEEAMEAGESCLIHSLYGKSRSCSVLGAYLMKKYSWSLHKSLEFISSKKENLNLRSNYLRQLEELQVRIKASQNLSQDWNTHNSEEELVLRNTLKNCKIQGKVGKNQISQKKHTKRITFDDKPTVHKLNTTQNLQTKQKQILNTTNTKSKRSILKGFQDNEQKVGESEEEKTNNMNNIINNINGNIVHVTVNNFIASNKPEVSKNPVNTRPYSSDQKDRKNVVNPKKTLLNDPMAFGSSLKSPYDLKTTGSKSSSLKGGTGIKKESGTRFLANERPQSAKHRGVPVQQMAQKDALMITNTSSSSGYGVKKRSQPTREEIFRRR